jgi:hypothetical protein
MAQLGNICPVMHGTIAGISGIVAPMTDGITYFFDWNAKERYPLTECPAVLEHGPVAPHMIPMILEQMRGAAVVHLR